MKLAWYRLLDTLQSRWNRELKTFRESKKWGERWRDYTRVGRRYSRVEFRPATDALSFDSWRIRPFFGWEFNCPNCKSYSLVTEADMPDILADWEKLVQNCIRQGLKVPVKPTMATAGCTNCKYRPGAPE
jgi:hypothetical protein